MRADCGASGNAWLPVLSGLGDLPPLYGPGDFSLERLAVIRRAASELYDSGFLLITESHHVAEVIERCDETAAFLASHGEGGA
jgi:hypothetical protein